MSVFLFIIVIVGLVTCGEVDRLTEEQRFLTRLLESAPAGIRLPPGTAGGGGGADPEPTTEGTG